MRAGGGGTPSPEETLEADMDPAGCSSIHFATGAPPAAEQLRTAL